MDGDPKKTKIETIPGCLLGIPCCNPLGSRYTVPGRNFGECFQDTSSKALLMFPPQVRASSRKASKLTWLLQPEQ